MDRREFFKKSLAIGSAAGLAFIIDGIKPRGILNAQSDSSVIPDLVAIKGGNPDTMFDKGIAEFGGMKKFVKKGQTVVIKPNIGWNRTPEYGANTNPFLIKRIIEHCLNAGAKKVYVFDNSCDYWKDSYTNSGIEKAALNAGAQVVPGNKESYYQTINIANAQILKATKIHELILESDVFINVPVLKSHSSTGLTIAMKNLMGAVWDRGYFHQRGLHTCITDSCFAKKPTLNIVDAYTFMKSGGPRGINKENTVILKSQLISTDIVAIDAAAAKLADTNPENIQYIKMGNDRKLGVMNLNKLNIKRLTV